MSLKMDKSIISMLFYFHSPRFIDFQITAGLKSASIHFQKYFKERFFMKPNQCVSTCKIDFTFR